MTTLKLTSDESRVLEILAEATEPMTSAEIREKLGHTDSIVNFSEMLKHEYITIASRPKGHLIAWNITPEGKKIVNPL